jgi:hypothetical protein
MSRRPDPRPSSFDDPFLKIKFLMRRLGMKVVWKLLCLLGLVVLVAVTVFTYTVLSQAPPPATLFPIVSVCALFAGGLAVRSANPAFIKRFTTATGFG